LLNNLSPIVSPLCVVGSGGAIAACSCVIVFGRLYLDMLLCILPLLASSGDLGVAFAGDDSTVFALLTLLYLEYFGGGADASVAIAGSRWFRNSNVLVLCA
jgi:hypothetical protein